jgi:hypothetical protein
VVAETVAVKVVVVKVAAMEVVVRVKGTAVAETAAAMEVVARAEGTAVTEAAAAMEVVEMVELLAGGIETSGHCRHLRSSCRQDQCSIGRGYHCSGCG